MVAIRSHPPLSCRTSPPQGGRLRLHKGRHQSQTLNYRSCCSCQPISPLVGEMSGRTEGGGPVKSPTKRGAN
ncbi:hypothetical protein C5748_19405 [Phyllobacterium phragmitis]|uniref:Propionyl-coenzyme A carboxylase alpha polypeptide n=1 Tax=Phyllobacterium phragmitis TaxID=2670329 RepID=A0A2S9IMX9_9HYPH|nr:hypothetical protein C5748_19405 [Phyllobacterium phragmitis]